MHNIYRKRDRWREREGEREGDGGREMGGGLLCGVANSEVVKLFGNI